jgi:uncharacterized membrane protein
MFPSGPSTSSATDDTLIGIAFGDLFRAREFLSSVTRLASMGQLKLKDAVFVVAGADGATVVQETTDPTPGKAAMSGAVWASLIGLLLGGPVGWIAGAAIGAGAGATTAKFVDLGIPDEWVEWFRAAATPGKTTLAVLASDVNRNALADELTRFAGAQLVYANIEQHTIDRWRTALGERVTTESTTAESTSDRESATSESATSETSATSSAPVEGATTRAAHIWAPPTSPSS